MTARKPLSKSKVDNIGRAAAKLHHLLKELGHAKGLQQSAATMPDARDRLSRMRLTGIGRLVGYRNHLDQAGAGNEFQCQCCRLCELLGPQMLHQRWHCSDVTEESQSEQRGRRNAASRRARSPCAARRPGRSREINLV